MDVDVSVVSGGEYNVLIIERYNAESHIFDVIGAYSYDNAPVDIQVNALADACESDAKILGARIHEKHKLLKALREHGRGKCAAAKLL